MSIRFTPGTFIQCLSSTALFLFSLSIVRADGFPVQDGRYAGGLVTVIELTQKQITQLEDYWSLPLTVDQKATLEQETGKNAPESLFVYDIRKGNPLDDCTCEANDIGVWFENNKVDVPHQYFNRFPEVRSHKTNQNSKPRAPAWGRRLPFDLDTFLDELENCREPEKKSRYVCQRLEVIEAEMRKKYAHKEKFLRLMDETKRYVQGKREEIMDSSSSAKTPKDAPLTLDRLKEIAELQSVNLRDGVDENEAAILAKQYFDRKVAGCGAIDPAGDAGKLWSFRTLVGFAGNSGPTLFIDKQNGDVVLDGKRSPYPLEELLAN